MALYGTTNVSATTPSLQVMTTTYKTMLQITAQTTGIRRAFLYEYKVGPSGQPFATDCEIVWSLIRQTTLGTGTTMTSNALDAADSAAATVSTGNMTAEPTNAGEAGVIDEVPANQRGTYQWVVAPGGPGEIVVPATNLAGFGMRAKSSAYVGTGGCAFKYRE